MTTDQRRTWTRRAAWHVVVSRSVALLLSLAGTACKSTPQDVDPIGAYTLLKVGGKTLPCPVRHEGSPTVKSGTFTFNADRTCVSKITFTVPQRGKIVREFKATYTRDGTALTMKWEGAGVTTGTAEGDAFTMENEGILFEYRK
jgi:hypothetical protein